MIALVNKHLWISSSGYYKKKQNLKYVENLYKELTELGYHIHALRQARPAEERLIYKSKINIDFTW